MIEMPLLQRVAKTVEWWGCLFGWGENGYFEFGWGCKPQPTDTWRWTAKPPALDCQALGAGARSTRLAAAQAANT
jgi:hypothetical protein